ncbi:hypothetical protein ACIPX0_46150 [Streptomyces sp. NPDC090075]|uniref:hypothetical protein n=1 Tax=Streptomyces sp. NPDC090075 TaxID=3365937 RepID=UPI0037F85B7E
MPVFHSRDLLRRAQIGKALDRQSPFEVRPERKGASAGIHPCSGEGLRLLAGRAPAGREVSATLPEGDAALVGRIDDARWAAVERRNGTLSARVVIGPHDHVPGTTDDVPADRPLAIRASADTEVYGFAKGPDDLHLGYPADDGVRALATIDGRYPPAPLGASPAAWSAWRPSEATRPLTRFGYEPRPVPPWPSPPRRTLTALLRHPDQEPSTMNHRSPSRPADRPTSPPPRSRPHRAEVLRREWRSCPVVSS